MSTYIIYITYILQQEEKPINNISKDLKSETIK